MYLLFCTVYLYYNVFINVIFSPVKVNLSVSSVQIFIVNYTENLLFFSRNTSSVFLVDSNRLFVFVSFGFVLTNYRV